MTTNFNFFHLILHILCIIFVYPLSTRSNIEKKHSSTERPEPQHSTSGDTVEILSEQITPLTTAVHQTTEENKENNHVSNTDEAERKDLRTVKKMKLRFSIINLDYNEELADDKSERYIKMTESLRWKVRTTKILFPHNENNCCIKKLCLRCLR